MDNKIYELREKKSERIITRGTMEQIDKWLENNSEQDVTYEIWPTRERKCHQMSQDVTKCH